VFDSQPFQRSPAKKKRRDENAQQTNSTQHLQKGEADADDTTDSNFDIPLLGRRRVFVSASASIVPATPKEDPSITASASQQIKRRKDRQLGQKKSYDKRLTKEEDIILINVCIARFAKYDNESMRRF